MFIDRYRHIPALLAILALAACGGSSSPSAPAPAPTPTPTNLPQGSVSDPANDARADARIARSPDLVSATVEVTATDVRVNVRFAPGSFDRNTSLFQFILDTDENVQTGLPGVDDSNTDAALISGDYLLDNIDGRVLLIRCPTRSSAQCTSAGAPAATFVADGADIVISRAALGNDDGKMAFKVVAFANVSGIPFSQNSALFTPDLDVMPDIGLAAARVQ